MNTDALAISRQFVNQLKGIGVAFDHAYLFGSFARGKTWEGSDIDICLVSPDFQRDVESKRYKILRAAVTLDPRLEPVMYTPTEFANKYDSLAAEVKQFGISLL
jgi:predicted nucleotidyltransferase